MYLLFKGGNLAKQNRYTVKYRTNKIHVDNVNVMDDNVLVMFLST